MTNQRVDFETLNAYVDCELSPAEAASVARAAAHDPAVAAEIASLREVKAALSELAPAVTLSLPDEPQSWPFPLRQAAAAAALFAVLTLGVVLVGLPQHKSKPDWSSVIEAHHRSWVFSPGTGRGEMVDSGLAEIGPEALDLAAAQLAFAGREHFTYGNMVLDRLGYEGTRGCRLSLFRVPSDLAISTDAFTDPLHIRVWRDGEYNFLLIAHGMAAPRFQELATVIEQAIRNRRPIDAETQQRLAQARAASRPCQA